MYLIMQLKGLGTLNKLLIEINLSNKFKKIDFLFILSEVLLFIFTYFIHIEITY